MTNTPIDSHAPHGQGDLSRIYAQRFQANLDYRKKVWKILVSEFFSRHIPPGSSILDLGCGYGEFINSIPAKKRFAMDLNPDAPRHLDTSVTFLHQDCSQPWPLETQGLDAVFTSNFFEHLPDKTTLARTLDQIHSALRPGGRLIAMGPNIRCVPGAYWDFWDHYLPLTERSLAEALGNRGFRILQCHARFLPYTMAGKNPPHPSSSKPTYSSPSPGASSATNSSSSPKNANRSRRHQSGCFSPQVPPTIHPICQRRPLKPSPCAKPTTVFL